MLVYVAKLCGPRRQKKTRVDYGKLACYFLAVPRFAALKSFQLHKKLWPRLYGGAWTLDVLAVNRGRLSGGESTVRSRDILAGITTAWQLYTASCFILTCTCRRQPDTVTHFSRFLLFKSGISVPVLHARRSETRQLFDIPLFHSHPPRSRFKCLILFVSGRA